MKRGRPKSITFEDELYLANLFSLGLNVKEACLAAGIAKSTFYDCCKTNSRFKLRMNKAKRQTTLKALQTIKQKIESGDRVAAQWHLEKRDIRYSNKDLLKYLPEDFQNIPLEPWEWEIILSGLQKSRDRRHNKAPVLEGEERRLGDWLNDLDVQEFLKNGGDPNDIVEVEI